MYVVDKKQKQFTANRELLVEHYSVGSVAVVVLVGQALAMQNAWATATKVSPATPPSHPPQVRAKLFDTCNRKIRLFGECPYSFSFFGGLVA